MSRGPRVRRSASPGSTRGGRTGRPELIRTASSQRSCADASRSSRSGPRTGSPKARRSSAAEVRPRSARGAAAHRSRAAPGRSGWPRGRGRAGPSWRRASSASRRAEGGQAPCEELPVGERRAPGHVAESGRRLASSPASRRLQGRPDPRAPPRGSPAATTAGPLGMEHRLVGRLPGQPLPGLGRSSRPCIASASPDSPDGQQQRGRRLRQRRVGDPEVEQVPRDLLRRRRHPALRSCSARR